MKFMRPTSLLQQLYFSAIAGPTAQESVSYLEYVVWWNKSGRKGRTPKGRGGGFVAWDELGLSLFHGEW